jgi:hypothetical protein
MARISKYAADANLDKADQLIGTDSSGGTRNYSFEAIGSFLTNTNAVGVAGTTPFKYKSGALGSGNMQVVGSSSSSLAYPTADPITIRVSKYPNASSSSALATLNTFLNKEIIISQIQDPNIFSVYKVISIAQHNSTDFYNFGLEHLNSNNNSGGYGFITEVYYNITLYTGAQDKQYEKAFGTSDLIADSGEYYFEFSHGLFKYPSITVKISTGAIVEVPVKHVTKNKSRVYFKGLNSGTVYAN